MLVIGTDTRCWYRCIPCNKRSERKKLDAKLNLLWLRKKNFSIFLRAEASGLPPTDAGRTDKQGGRVSGRLWHSATCCRSQERNPAGTGLATPAGRERKRPPAEGALGASAEEDHQRGRDRGPGVRLPRGRVRDEQQHAGLRLLPPGQTPGVSAQSAGRAGPLLLQTREWVFLSEEIQINSLKLFKKALLELPYLVSVML